MLGDLNTGVYVDRYNNSILKNPISDFKREEIPLSVSKISTLNQEVENDSVKKNGRDYSSILKPPLVFLAKTVGAASLYIIVAMSLRYMTSQIANPFNFSIDNPLLVEAGRFSSNLYPHFIHETIVKYLPAININSKCYYGTLIWKKNVNINEVFVCAMMEEIVFRKFVQRFALPSISRILPETCGNILNHQLTRIALTSVVFASIHFSYFPMPMGVTAPLFGGFLLGALAESEGSLALPIASHFLSNALFDLQKSNIDTLSQYIFKSLETLHG